MLIFCDLQVFGCLTYGHASSVSVSWHFFAGRASTQCSLPRCSGQDQRADAGRLALVEQAVGDCVELVSGGAHVIEDQDVAPLCAGRVGDVQDLAERCCGCPLLGKALSGRLFRCLCFDDRRGGAGVEGPAPVIVRCSGRPDDSFDVARARLTGADVGGCSRRSGREDRLRREPRASRPAAGRRLATSRSCPRTCSCESCPAERRVVSDGVNALDAPVPLPAQRVPAGAIVFEPLAADRACPRGDRLQGLAGACHTNPGRAHETIRARWALGEPGRFPGGKHGDGVVHRLLIGKRESAAVAARSPAGPVRARRAGC